MLVKSIKTRVFIPPKDDLFSLLKESFSRLKLKEKSIFVITSKIVSIGQGRCVKADLIKDKDELIKKEAEFYLDRNQVPNKYAVLTLKQNILIPTAGIDESNAKGYFILWPENPYQVAKEIYYFIKKNYKLKKFGVIISDSHTTPLRWGTSGIAIAYFGFYPVRDYRGVKDIFGRKLKVTLANLVDGFTTAAVLVMGEGIEKTPLAVIEDIDFVKFKEFDPTKNNPVEINPDNDIYAPLLKAIKWKKGGCYNKKNK